MFNPFSGCNPTSEFIQLFIALLTNSSKSPLYSVQALCVAVLYHKGNGTALYYESSQPA